METKNRTLIDYLAYLPLAALCATLFFAPLTPDIKIIRPKLLVLQSGIFGAIVLWLGIAAARGALVFRRGALLAPVAAYAALGLFFYLLSPDKPVALMEFNRCVLSAFAYIAAVTLVRSDRALRWCLGSWLAGTFLASLYGILQHSGGVWLIRVPAMDRVMSTFGNPIFFAAHLVVSLPVAFGLLAGIDGEKRRRWAVRIARGALMVFLAAGLWALFLTKTRAAYLGCIAATVTFIFLRILHRHAADETGGKKKAPARPGSRIRAAAALAAGIVVVGFFAYATRAIWARQQAHLLIWRDTAAMWTTRPWLGTGAGTFHLYFPQFASDELKSIWPQGQCIVNDAHNEYLQILTETGIAGLGVFLWLLAAFFFARRRASQPIPPAMDGLMAGAAGLLVQNIFSVDMRFIISSVYLFTVFGAVDSFTARDAGVPLQGAGKKLAAFAAAGVLGYVLFSLALGPFLAQKKYAATPDFFDQKVLEAGRTVAELEALAVKYPTKPAVFEKLGWVYAKEKNWAKAVENYQAAQRLNPQSPGPYNNLGNIYFLTGNRDGAIACWQQSLAVDAGQIDSRLNLATAFYYQGRLKEAADQLKDVLKIDPGNEKAIVLLKQMTE